VAEFNKNQSIIQQLSQRQQQIIGQLNLIEELEKEESQKEIKEKVDKSQK
jgi:hypothetical protein